MPFSIGVALRYLSGSVQGFPFKDPKFEYDHSIHCEGVLLKETKNL